MWKKRWREAGAWASRCSACMCNRLYCYRLQTLKTFSDTNPWNILSPLTTVAVAAPAGLKPASSASICSSSNQHLDRDVPCDDLSALVVPSHVFRLVARKCWATHAQMQKQCHFHTSKKLPPKWAFCSPSRFSSITSFYVLTDIRTTVSHSFIPAVLVTEKEYDRQPDYTHKLQHNK